MAVRIHDEKLVRSYMKEAPHSLIDWAPYESVDHGLLGMTLVFVTPVINVSVLKMYDVWRAYHFFDPEEWTFLGEEKSAELVSQLCLAHISKLGLELKKINRGVNFETTGALPVVLEPGVIDRGSESRDIKWVPAVEADDYTLATIMVKTAVDGCKFTTRQKCNAAKEWQRRYPRGGRSEALRDHPELNDSANQAVATLLPD